MRSLILGIYVIVMSGCGGSVDLSVIGDAGAGGNTATSPKPEQQLTLQVPTWCPQICAKLNQCDPAGADTGCKDDCINFLTQQYLGKGDACAQLGLDFISCANNMTCNDLLGATGQTCESNATAEGIACGSGTGGSTDPGGNTTGPAVTCRDGYGVGSIGNAPIGSQVCDNSYSTCSDGHLYEVICVNLGNNQLGCTCYLDGASQTPFVANGTGCPQPQVVNTTCGWHLQ